MATLAWHCRNKAPEVGWRRTTSEAAWSPVECTDATFQSVVEKESSSSQGHCRKGRIGASRQRHYNGDRHTVNFPLNWIRAGIPAAQIRPISRSSKGRRVHRKNSRHCSLNFSAPTTCRLRRLCETEEFRALLMRQSIRQPGFVWTGPSLEKPGTTRVSSACK